MKDKLLAEIQKCETRLEVLREMLHDFQGEAPAKKKMGRPRKVVVAPTEAAPRKKPGPKPKAKPAKAAKAAKPDKPKVQAKKGGKHPRLVYPGVDVVLAALSSNESKSITAVAEEVKSEQKLVSVVVKKLVKDGKVKQDGGGRWTTYKLA